MPTTCLARGDLGSYLVSDAIQMGWSVKKWGETSNLMVDGCSSSAVKWPFRGCTPSNRPKLSKQQRSATWQAHSKHVSKSISFTALSSMSENRTWTLHFQLIQHTNKRTNSCNPGKWEQAPKKSGDLKFFSSTVYINVYYPIWPVISH